MASHERLLPRADRDDPSRVRELAHDSRVYLARLAIIAALTAIVVVVWSESTGDSPAGGAVDAGVQSGVIRAPAPENRSDFSIPTIGAGSQTQPQPTAIPRPPELAEPERPMSFVHFVVQPGDTIFLISVVYGVTVDDILQFNPHLGDGSRVDVGDEVIVPVFAP